MDAWDEILAFLAREHEFGRPHVQILAIRHIRFNNDDTGRAIPYLVKDNLVTLGLKAGCVSITPAGLAYHNIGATAL